MTEATFNANNYIAFCSILSKFRMWMYDRMKNIYAQNQLSICCSCERKAVHNRIFEEPSYSYVTLVFNLVIEVVIA